MKIFCRAGLHKPRAGSRLNAGYRFSTCERCGRDLVRSATGRWRAPRGYRVVWRTRAEAASQILLGTSPGSTGKAGGSRSDLPIQEVLRLLQNYDFVDQREPDPPPGTLIAVRTEEAISRFDAGDFMSPQTTDVVAGPRRSVFSDHEDDAPAIAAGTNGTRKP
jgi:hypothetical protein